MERLKSFIASSRRIASLYRHHKERLDECIGAVVERPLVGFGQRPSAIVSIAIAPTFRNLITRMFPLAEEAMKTLANFHSTVMAGLTRPSSHTVGCTIRCAIRATASVSSLTPPGVSRMSRSQVSPRSD